MMRVTGTAREAHAFAAVREWLGHCGLQIVVHAEGQRIPGSYWGEPEAGLIGHTVHVRTDTPLHSMLHEACHALCMDARRRTNLFCDAGGDDLEESAVCYLQLCIAREIDALGVLTLARDMDDWGYSFRAGSTLRWFTTDAQDAHDWLRNRAHLAALIPATMSPIIAAAAC